MRSVSVDDLRAQLRERGYLTHGIERWFALDPWSSRAFWLELLTVALKAAILIGAFGALPMTAVMLFRNYPLGAFETLALFACYAAAWTAAAFLLVLVAALALKLRPALPIDTPRALLAISIVASSVLVLPVAVWWYRFDAGGTIREAVAGAALSVVFFLVATIVVSAALLSFSIHEVHRVPAIHQKPRTVPMSIAAACLIALLFVPAWADRERAVAAPMVVTTPTLQRVALIAVDGLTSEILQSRPDLAAGLPFQTPVHAIEGRSTTERWASLGTGVRTEQHGVRAIEGVRFRGGVHILQRVSSADFVLLEVAPLLRLVRREPLPPTVRRRDYIWETFAERGVPSAAVNWWATDDDAEGALHSVSPERVFTGAGATPLRLDEIASSLLMSELARNPRFATVYMPALDVILNRLDLDRSAQVASSVRALDGITATVAEARRRGYEVVLVGMPGEGQRGSAIIASTLRLPIRTAWDLAPALLGVLGFPLSSEMPGGPAGAQRIASYGARRAPAAVGIVNQEYYDNLRSLGYIR
jgi:phosphoribosylcarboxyaminoimidazole (NCAIR) mutase